MAKRFFVKQFTAGSCYSYIISSIGEALVIDPHISLLKNYESYLVKNNLKLKIIVDTHTHADHFSLAAVLKKKYGAKVLMGEKAISSVRDISLKNNDEAKISEVSLRVLYTPGHTDDAISLFGEKTLFTGDVLLIGSVGRADFQNGSPESMFDTLQRLKELPDDTVVFPGHDYHEKLSSTISREKNKNPYLQEENKEAFVRNMRAKQIPKPFNIDNIIRVNRKGEAVTLEMISPRDAQSLAQNDSNAKFLDVRSAFEFVQMHIKDSINIPIDMLGAKIDDLSKADNKYIVFCRTGNRSPMAADMLIQAGLHNVKVMDGGITSWQKERLPVIKGEGGISLERQVRLLAGSFVLVGLLLYWFLHPAFVIIPIFVSCGLIYSGLSDNCLMGMLLMKLPYNKKLYKTKLGGGTCSVS
ncbi:MAG: rhodanese-like domain-containing protein [Candidatus Omnitrophica bacterium]|jgi:glyoxylase-like metal-dependent hydrolase (beta-lactamase superfamily II)|nr:rhodanese-like domain-containing protein [Candidatus Omnitrophota bacterium]